MASPTGPFPASIRSRAGSASRLARLCILLGLGVASAFARGQAPPLGDIVQLAAGLSHTCALTAAGAVKCWGGNEFGQLGDGSRSDRYTLIDVPGLQSGVQAIAAGAEHTCALLDDGSVQCWGLNVNGQLGLGDDLLRESPEALPALTAGVVALAAGDDHSCALLNDGTLKCWGANYAGQLGTGDFTDSPVPVAVTGIVGGATAITAGHRHTCAIVGGGLQCWGFNFAGQIGDGSNGVGNDRNVPTAVVGLGSGVAAVALGSRHSCALTTGGAVQCWGANTSSQLGNDLDGNDQTTPGPVVGLDAGVAAIALGEDHSCALLDDGSLQCWGRNDLGQLGDGTPERRHTPTPVLGLPAGAGSLALGWLHSCATVPGGHAFCWGLNFNGQLGDGSTGQRFAPTTRVQGAPPTPRVVVGGERHSCALGGSGDVRCWGWNLFGALGDGTTLQRLLPVSVQGLSGPIQTLAANGFSTCALTDAGGVRCWGRNDFGQLGNGFIGDETQAVDVVGLQSGMRSIAVGLQHACASGDDGMVRCWGANFSGQLGDGSFDPQVTPVSVPGLTDVEAVYASAQTHTCALLTGGAVKCWGGNDAGQLGDGSLIDSNTPVDVQNLGAPVQALALGYTHSCALTTDGAVKCWGSNAFLQLGDAAIDNGSTTPVDVPGLGSDVVEIAAAGQHSCARFASGRVRCWGRNDIGQAGDGTTLAPLTPTEVAGITFEARGLGMGGQHACLRLVDDRIACWGSNYDGQFGDGSFGGKPLPVPVLIDGGARNVADVVPPPAATASLDPSSDAAGRFLAFQSNDPDLPGAGVDGAFDVYRVDTVNASVERVSLDHAGDPIGGNVIEPAISADGRLIVFVADDTQVGSVQDEGKAQRARRLKGGGFGVYLRDMTTGSTLRIGDAQPDGSDTLPQISADGSAVAFAAVNTDPLQGADGQSEIFRVTLAREGGTLKPQQTVCASCKAVAADGSDTEVNADGPSRHPTLSANGQWLAWESAAGNVMDGQAPACPQAGTEVVLRNLLTGTVRVPSAPSSAGECGSSGRGAGQPHLDWSGQRLVYTSDRPLKPDAPDALPTVHLFEAVGARRMPQSVAPDGGEANGAALRPRISGDGQVISFVSAATNLDAGAADNNERIDLHVRDLRRGAILRLTQNRTGDATDGDSLRPALNYNGTRLAFDSDAGNLSPVATGQSTVYQRANPFNAQLIHASGFE